MLWQSIGWATGAVWATQAALLCAEATAAFFVRTPGNAMPEPNGTALLLIPAHNEAANIAATLAHFDSFLSPSLLGVVLCDNSTDATYEIVRRFPRWTLWERFDAARAGKGFAVQDVARRVTVEMPEVDVIVVSDTDSRADLSSLQRLVATCRTSGRTVQALTRLRPSPTQPGSVLSVIAWWWHNDIRERGRATLGLGGFLQGTGLAFPRRDFEALPAFPTSDVEDKTWTVELHRQGRAPRFEPLAVWTSGVAEGNRGWQRQRRRWELGHLAEIAHRLPGIVGAFFFRHELRLLYFAIDFSVPPLFLFATLGILRTAVFLDAFTWIFLAWLIIFGSTLTFHFLCERIVPTTAVARAVAPWLRLKFEIAIEAAQILFRRPRSLW